MTADFKHVCWLLDHNYTTKVIGEHQYYFYTHYHKTFYVRSLDPVEPKDDYRDRYVCYINKVSAPGDIVTNSAITFSSDDWIRATGITPKEAIRDAITKAYDDPAVKSKDELRSYDLTLNPILWFIKDCISAFTR